MSTDGHGLVVWLLLGNSFKTISNLNDEAFALSAEKNFRFPTSASGLTASLSVAEVADGRASSSLSADFRGRESGGFLQDHGQLFN